VELDGEMGSQTSPGSETGSGRVSGIGWQSKIKILLPQRHTFWYQSVSFRNAVGYFRIPLLPMPDTSLSFLDQLRQGEASGQWNQLVALYTPILQSWLRRYDDLPPADMEDILQEVLLAVSQELPRFEHNQKPGAFRSWLRQILVHRLRRFWEARQRQPKSIGGSDFLGELQELQDDASRISQIWNKEHDRQVLQHLLGLVRSRVAPQTWDAFHLLVIDEQPPREVAARLGLSLGSVYAAKSRVLQALRSAAAGLV
jgi:RNA polymerase sigma-70 factor (ECF subfamily)